MAAKLQRSSAVLFPSFLFTGREFPTIGYQGMPDSGHLIEMKKCPHNYWRIDLLDQRDMKKSCRLSLSTEESICLARDICPYVFHPCLTSFLEEFPSVSWRFPAVSDRAILFHLISNAPTNSFSSDNRWANISIANICDWYLLSLSWTSTLIILISNYLFQKRKWVARFHRVFLILQALKNVHSFQINKQAKQRN